MPFENQERVKLVNFVGRNDVTEKFLLDWRWGHHKMMVPLDEHVLQDVISHSLIFRVSWPPPDDENTSSSLIIPGENGMYSIML